MVSRLLELPENWNRFLELSFVPRSITRIKTNKQTNQQTSLPFFQPTIAFFLDPLPLPFLELIFLSHGSSRNRNCSLKKSQQSQKTKYYIQKLSGREREGEKQFQRNVWPALIESRRSKEIRLSVSKVLYATMPISPSYYFNQWHDCDKMHRKHGAQRMTP